MTNSIERVRIEWLYKQSFATQTMGFVNAALYAYLSFDVIPTSTVIAWISLVFIIYVGRMILQRVFNASFVDGESTRDPASWERYFVMATLVAGAAWGVAGSWLLPPGQIVHHTFLGFLLAGTTAGASIAYVPSKKAVHAFLLPSLLPFAIGLLLEQNRFATGMSILTILFFILLTILINKMNKYVVDSIQLRFEKDELMNELKAAQVKMIHSAKMTALGEMAGGISHEINNPLAVIDGEMSHLELLAKGNKIENKDIQKSAEGIHRMVTRISLIIKGLRAFAREGKHDPRELTSVRKIVQEVLSFCQVKFEKHGINLIVDDIPNNLLLECRSVQISQVLINMLNNAYDAVEGKKDPWIKLEVKLESDSAIFSVSDNGAGVNETIREKIMQPFFTTKDVGKGTGLGLSISKGIIESHGGTFFLDAQSPYTRFVMSLPRAVIDPEC